MLTHITRGAALQFEYENFRGETKTRNVKFEYAGFGSNEYYPEPTTLFTCFDLDKMALRTFDTKRMKNIRLTEG